MQAKACDTFLSLQNENAPREFHRRPRNVIRGFQRNESLACHRALVQEPLRVASGAFGFSFFGFLVSFL
jgi:hypothetical protein